MDVESHDDENVELPLGFSFWDDARKCFKPIITAERETLLKELNHRYPQIESITISIPFIIIECRESVPLIDQQIFMAAGLVCVFMTEGERFPFGLEFIGYYGEGEMSSDAPEHISRDIRPFHFPKLATFECIHKLIPDATHVSSYPAQLVVELESTSPEIFEEKLKYLPSGIESMSIGYVNGKFLLGPPQSRLKAPDPTHMDGDYDDTDYLSPENSGSLRPGIILGSRGIIMEDGSTDGIMYTNSGVKLCRQDRIRFTCAKHGWDKPSIDNAVYHGNP